MSNSSKLDQYPSSVGAPAEHPADPKVVGPSTDPLVVEMGPIVNATVPDAPAPAEFKFVDALGKEHDTPGEAIEASVPPNPKSEKDDDEE